MYYDNDVRDGSSEPSRACATIAVPHNALGAQRTGQSPTEALGDTGNQIDAKLPANTIGFETGQTHPFAP